MKSVKFSVIIPTYNAQNTISQAIESCIKQSLPPWEIIIVDDCSIDYTLNILNNYRNHPFIKIFVLKENGGVSVARNFGWNKSTGDYVSFLDADDIWDVNKLKILNEVIQTEKNVLCIGHQYTDDKIFFLSEGVFRYKILHYWQLLFRNYFNTSCLTVSKQISERFNEHMRYTEDHELYLRILNITNIFFIQLPLTLLGRPQLSKGGLSGNRLKMRKGELIMYYETCKKRKKLFILFLFLCLFSIIKYLIKLLHR
ncbi:putative teichuronic acid biosynthesis glycosyltransferase TuaG [termite gut metagenome]|uniref:Putative teichuronic acid biosynthesis glycosyltransferase TuaG n=1 Tax=termite gut metagenome TaxID=433724 RepID=A0A5J4RJH0_9ZZZZ